MTKDTKSADAKNSGETKQKNDLMTSMLKAGVHFGHQKSKWHPKMAPYIFGVRNNIHIIDLEKTIAKLEEALVFVKDVVGKEGIVLFVGTKKQAAKIVEDVAKKTEMPYVSNRWIGGTFTNFKEISKRVNHLLDLEKKQDSGELKKYTKKEQLGFTKEIEKLNKLFGGIKKMKKLPNAIFVIDAKEEKSAVKEAKESKVPVIALCDTNYNPSEIDYPIPANDDAVSSIAIMAETVADAIKEGQKNKGKGVSSKEQVTAKEQEKGEKEAKK